MENALREVIKKEQPDLIVPEIEAIATDTLVELESEGFTVIPTARAARLTMNREGIRRLAAEELGLKTSPYRFASNLEEYRAAVRKIGVPCVIKPIMSSSGKGQSTVKNMADAEKSWAYAQEGARGGADAVIVEGFVDFDYEITLLTLRHEGGTSFCAPIGHRQVDGDYRESWQPQPMSEVALAESQRMGKAITDALGGRGIFGVELFVKGDDIYFSEVSPRPHDTGMVTMISQDLSEFALHARAILGLPVPYIKHHGPICFACNPCRRTLATSAIRQPERSTRRTRYRNPLIWQTRSTGRTANGSRPRKRRDTTRSAQKGKSGRRSRSASRFEKICCSPDQTH